MPILDRKTSLLLAILATACLLLGLISLPALEGPLVLDSNKLYALEEITEKHGKNAIFHTPEFGFGFNRILSMSSFLLNIQFSNSLSPAQLKATNVAIHMLSSILAFLLIRVLVLNTALRERASHIALVSSLLWLLSPINFNTTIYTIQRMTLLSAMFILLGLYLYSIGRLSKVRAGRTLYVGAALLICLPLAALSKENGILLAAFIFLAEFYFINPAHPFLSNKKLALIGIAGAIASTVAFIYFFPGAINYEHRNFSLVERLLSQPRAIASYLQEIIFPLGGDIGIFSDDFKESKSLFNPISTLFSALLLIAIIILSFWTYRIKQKLVSFGLFFYLIGHSIESSFLSLELFFPHRNYLPSLGVYLVIAFGINRFLPDRKWKTIIVVIMVAYFSTISYARSLTWSSRENIIVTSLNYHSNSPRALSNYAQLALEQGNLQLAYSAVSRSINLRNTLNLHIQRLYILCAAGVEIPDNQYKLLLTTENLGVSTELAQAISNLFLQYQTGMCHNLDVPKLVITLDEISNRFENLGLGPWAIEYYIAKFLYSSGQAERAHKRLQKRLVRGHAESGLYRVELLLMEGEVQDARDTLELVKTKLNDVSSARLESTINNFSEQITERSL